eukprot:TRINITY_DN4492_c0_g1_i1.p1 TRINITY_DN4492_c0_g1~~TRINITY_DN4492_c0_g1_i1.p1  ORF type:complete len:295 (+),score=43.27 TRINITY_DN4492_c0_g1_i1:110-886(+)
MNTPPYSVNTDPSNETPPPPVQIAVARPIPVEGGVLVPLHSTETLVSEELSRRAKGLRILCIIELFFWCWAALIDITWELVILFLSFILFSFVGIYGSYYYSSIAVLIHIFGKALMFCVLFGISVSVWSELARCSNCTYSHPEQLTFLTVLIIIVLAFQLFSAYTGKRVRHLILQGDGQKVDNFELTAHSDNAELPDYPQHVNVQMYANVPPHAQQLPQTQFESFVPYTEHTGKDVPSYNDANEVDVEDSKDTDSLLK